jgi:hypothetical protein
MTIITMTIWLNDEWLIGDEAITAGFAAEWISISMATAALPSPTHNQHQPAPAGGGHPLGPLKF